MSQLIKSKRSSNNLIINRLAVILKEERVSNKDLADTLGYEAATVSKWATNTIQPPLSTFLRIAVTINRDLKDFFVSTKDIDQDEKVKLLEELTMISAKGKRTGKGKI